MTAFIGLFLLIYLLVLGFGVLSYVLQSLGMYTIAKRRGIRNPWLAWVPVGSSWMLGCISDQYQYVARGQVKSKRKVLVGINIAAVILAIVMIVCFVWFGVENIAVDDTDIYDEEYIYDDYFYSDDYYDIYEDPYDYGNEAVAGEAVAPALGFFASYVILLALGIVSSVLTYMALYDLYRSCDPGNSVLFLLLSIFISVTQPFLIFAYRNRDGGMPPRQDQMYQQPTYQPPQPPVWQPPQPPKEPWE